MASLTDKVAIVTGGAAGIGAAICRALAREGADIAIPDIQDANAQAVVKEVLGMGRRAISMRCDVTKSAEVQATVDRIRKEMGQIDILVNNAGMASAPGMPFTNNSEEDWDRTYAVNLKSVFLMCKALAPYFIERKAGRIINIASIAGPLAALTQVPSLLFALCLPVEQHCLRPLRFRQLRQARIPIGQPQPEESRQTELEGCHDLLSINA